MANSSKKPKQKSIWYGKIDTPEEALNIIKGASIFFYVVAGLQIIVGVLLTIDGIINGIGVALLAYLLRRYNSRIVSVILLLLAVVGFLLIMYRHGSISAVMSIVMIWISARVTQATFKLKKLQD